METKTNSVIDNIDSFSGKYEFLSMEYPCEIKYGNETYNNAFSLLYSFKTNNDNVKRKIAKLSSLKARQKVAKLTAADINESYEDDKNKYLEITVRAKFDCNPEFKKLLIKTYPAKLINNLNYRDEWLGLRYGKGDNELGKLLTKLRLEYLKKNRKGD